MERHDSGRVLCHKRGIMTDGRDIGKRLDRPVVLVGMMGAGKTRLGRMLGQALDLPFIDTDDMAVAAAGMDIPQIFATRGEAVFRQYESAAIRKVLQDEPVPRVVSTGGGAVMQQDNADLVFGKALSIWTRADIAVLLDRVGRKNDRPLLQNGDPEKTLRQMAEIRYPVYCRADLTVDTDGKMPDEILAHMLKLIEERLKSCSP